ncbi:hypothetical protein AB0E69_39310 [Kribbella sp. NPDC026611]|uniref:hypothetical protein n=1 Tax=Kribbella sp. NPDC026611 TaxID=3154911 RepID=UPI0033D3DBE5
MTAGRFGYVVRAELDKLRTLPITILAAIGTVLVAVVIAAAQVEADQPVDVVPYVEAGLVLVGVISSSHEYAGRQVRISLIAVPARQILVAGKTVAVLITVVVVAVLSVTAAAATQYVLDGHLVHERLAGATACASLIGLLAHAFALLVRHLVPALVGMLTLVLVVSPVLGAITDQARWLPDRAAAQLYSSTDTVLTAATGSLVALAWILAVGTAAVLRFVRSDAGH